MIRLCRVNVDEISKIIGIYFIGGDFLLQGIGVSEGIGIALAMRYDKKPLEIPMHMAKDTALETSLFFDAIEDTIGNTQELSARMQQKNKNAAEIFDAHLTLLRDEKGLHSPIITRIENKKANAAQAVWEEMGFIAQTMRSLDDNYLRERASDIEDLREVIVRHLLGIVLPDLSSLVEDCVLVSDDLSPSDTAKLDIQHIKAFVTARGGATGHTAIMAQSMEIPAVVGCADILQVKNGDQLIVDGYTGQIHHNPSTELVETYYKKQKELLQKQIVIQQYRTLPTVTADGKTLELYANIGTPEDAKHAMKFGAEGIGLVRSEFLYMERTTLPDEEEQYEAYCSILQKMKGRPVTIRTLDAGGDKSLPALTLSHEENPFLGFRAIRICLKETELFKTQLRALLRASVEGDLRIMFPMISTMQQLRDAKNLLDEAKMELKARSETYREDIPIGIMVEIPATALIADSFAQEVDFFSIGTNDLIQYTLAVDRGNPNVTELYTSYHPAILQLIERTIKATKCKGIACGMCGEAAGDALLVPLLLGIGLEKFLFQHH